MTEPLKSVGAITLFVEDPQRAKAFYQNVFEVSVNYEDKVSAAFKFDNMIVNLLAISEAPGLIGPGTVAEGNTGSRFQLTIRVSDADAVCEELASRGVALLNGPMNRAWGMRTAAFTDPDGHIWEIAQEIKWAIPSFPPKAQPRFQLLPHIEHNRARARVGDHHERPGCKVLCMQVGEIVARLWAIFVHCTKVIFAQKRARRRCELLIAKHIHRYVLIQKLLLGYSQTGSQKLNIGIIHNNRESFTAVGGISYNRCAAILRQW